jgi:RNA polymerase sigma-70 factor, ECF subfamily
MLLDDARAVTRLKHGDISGLEALVRRYQVEALRAALLTIQDEAVAEDAVQSAFLKVVERIDQFDSRRPFRPWFMKIVINEALKVVRGNGRSVALDAAPGDLILDPAPGPETAVSHIELEEMIWEALGKLSPDQRAVIVMHYYLGFTESEMSNEVRRPVGTIRWRLWAARQALWGLLSQSQIGWQEDPQPGEVDRNE